MPGAQRRGRRVRARSPVQRLDGRARCLRRVAGARSGGRRATGRRRSSSARSFPRCVLPASGARESVADERYRSHRAIRRLLELLARRPSARARARRPALERRRVDRADRRRCCGAAPSRRSSSRSPSGRARRPAACPPRSRCPSVRRIALGELSEAQAARAAGRSRAGERSPPSTATAAATRSTSSSSRAPAGKRGVTRRRAATERETGFLPPSPRRSPRSSRRCRGRSARCWMPPPSPASRSSPASRPRSPSCPRPTGSRRSTGSWRSISCVRRRCRGASSSATRSCAARSSSRRRVAGSSRPTPGPRPRWLRGAPQRPSARTTSSTPRARVTSRPSRCSCARARRRRRALRPWLPTGSKRRCGCCRRRTASGRSTFASTSPGRCARSVSSSAAGRRCWMRWHCFPPTRWRAGSS